MPNETSDSNSLNDIDTINLQSISVDQIEEAKEKNPSQPQAVAFHPPGIDMTKRSERKVEVEVPSDRKGKTNSGRRSTLVTRISAGRNRGSIEIRSPSPERGMQTVVVARNPKTTPKIQNPNPFVGTPVVETTTTTRTFMMPTEGGSPFADMNSPQKQSPYSSPIVITPRDRRRERVIGSGKSQLVRTYYDKDILDRRRPEIIEDQPRDMDQAVHELWKVIDVLGSLTENLTMRNKELEEIRKDPQHPALSTYHSKTGYPHKKNEFVQIKDWQVSKSKGQAHTSAARYTLDEKILERDNLDITRYPLGMRIDRTEQFLKILPVDDTNKQYFTDVFIYSDQMPKYAIEKSDFKEWEQIFYTYKDNIYLDDEPKDYEYYKSLFQGYRLKHKRFITSYIFPTYLECRALSNVDVYFMLKLMTKTLNKWNLARPLEKSVKFMIPQESEDEILGFRPIDSTENGPSNETLKRHDIRGLIGSLHTTFRSTLVLAATNSGQAVVLKIQSKIAHMSRLPILSSTNFANSPEWHNIKKNVFKERMTLDRVKNCHYSIKPLWFDHDNYFTYIAFPYGEAGPLDKVFGKILRYHPEKISPLTYTMIPYHWLRHIAMMILCGVEELHKLDIIHNDIKGANIFVYKDGSLKLGDFHSSEDFLGIISNKVCGTYTHMSPESIWPELYGGYDKSKDFFATATVVLQCIFCVNYREYYPLAPWDEYNEIILHQKIPLHQEPNRIVEIPELYEYLSLSLYFDPKKRLKTFKDIIALKFFEGMNVKSYQNGEHLKHAPSGYADAIRSVIADDVSPPAYDIMVPKDLLLGNSISDSIITDQGGDMVFFPDNLFSGWVNLEEYHSDMGRVPDDWNSKKYLKFATNLKLREFTKVEQFQDKDIPMVDRVWGKIYWALEKQKEEKK
ncbi:hypothetical protein SNEBB_000546 [Seison nebaliae]|nr:hypothetical protein SNEBB_000546 [Seison nebaliae]